MRKLLIAAVAGGIGLAAAPGGAAYAKGHEHRAAAPHAAAHRAEHPAHGHFAAARGARGEAHPGFERRGDWDDWRAARSHHHNRLPYIIFGVLSGMLARQ